jgi:hypothetical protein
VADNPTQRPQKQKNSAASARFRARKRKEAQDMQEALDDALRENGALMDENQTLMEQNRAFREIIISSGILQTASLDCPKHREEAGR